MKRLSRAILLLAILAAMPVAIAACGGGGDEEEAPLTTTDEYITQADEICSQSDEENATAARKAFGQEQPTKEEAVAYVSEVLVPALEAQLETLRGIEPPEGDAETVNAIYDEIGGVIESIKEDPEGSLAVEDPFAEVTPDAEAYGFKSCGVN